MVVWSISVDNKVVAVVRTSVDVNKVVDVDEVVVDVVVVVVVVVLVAVVMVVVVVVLFVAIIVVVLIVGAVVVVVLDDVVVVIDIVSFTDGVVLGTVDIFFGGVAVAEIDEGRKGFFGHMLSPLVV